MTVTDSDKEAMKKILSALDGDKTALMPNKKKINESSKDVILTGHGQVTSEEIDAMAQVLNRLNNVTSQVLTESQFDSQLNEAINTKRLDDGVKVGNYQIIIKEDVQRIAGKQYYGIYHSQSGDIIADDISLYEVALNVVKQLNNGKYVNSTIVRKLFEADDRYTAHRTDAIRFKNRVKSFEKNKNFDKSQLYENRYQASVSNVMATKKEIKELIKESKRS